MSAVASAEPEPLTLTPVARLGDGAGKEISGIVRSRAHPEVFWTLNDSGDEPRIYPVRADGTLVTSVRYPETPGVLIAGAINSDWEDIALDASGRIIVADVGNNSNARRDLTLYLIEEPEATEGRTRATTAFTVRHPDQPAFPAPKDNFNFDAEAVFTVGDDIFILSKNRSDTFTKLYRVDARAPGVVNTLTYLDRFDIMGQATGADSSDDGLRLAILTYDRLWLFERDQLDQPFFAGRVRSRPYRLPDGASDSESICFESATSLLIADEARGTLFRASIEELPEVRPANVKVSGDGANDLRVMSFNIRYAGADDGPNAWPGRRDDVAALIHATNPDLLGLQEAEAAQCDWLREQLPTHEFHGVGRIDGARAGEATPIYFRRDRFTLLASGHFWISPTPDTPGLKGWDAACERMASWVRLRDRRTGSPLLVLNTHLDHVGERARAEGVAMIRARAASLAEGAPIIITGDFNASADGPLGQVLTEPTSQGPGASRLIDTFRMLYPSRDADEVTFNGWKPVINGDRIDWIFASDVWQIVDAAIDRRMPDGRPPSDHYPVTVQLRPRGP